MCKEYNVTENLLLPNSPSDLAPPSLATLSHLLFINPLITPLISIPSPFHLNLCPPLAPYFHAP